MSTESPRDSQEVPGEEPVKIPRIMVCSDCRAFSKTAYFNLGGRPLCPRCAGKYRASIERGTGSAAMTRAVLYGGGAAIVGMLGVALLLSFINGFRIIVSIGVAYLIAKAIGKATDNYGGRRYQILAVSLTYLALGLGMLIPVGVAAHRLSTVTAPPKREARFGPAGESAAWRDEMNAIASQPGEGEDSALVAARQDSIARADSVARVEATRANLAARDGNAKAAQQLGSTFGARIVGAVVLILLLPVISSFLFYGLYAAVFSLLALGYAMRQAWKLTEIVVDYDLTGPFRVGEGPIEPRM